jgi:hypothetical protein
LQRLIKPAIKAQTLKTNHTSLMRSATSLLAIGSSPLAKNRRSLQYQTHSFLTCFTIESFYEEVIVASVKDTELSYCYGCDWIVQEFHGGKWETRNSQPFPGRPLNELPHFAQLIRDLRCSAEIDERAILV